MVETAEAKLLTHVAAKLPAHLKDIFHALPSDVKAVLKHIADDSTDTGTQSARTLATVEIAKEKDEKNKDLESHKAQAILLVRTLQAQGKSEADIVLAVGQFHTDPAMANFVRDVAKDEIARNKSEKAHNFPPLPAPEQVPAVAKGLFAVLDLGATTSALATGKPAMQHFAQAPGSQQLAIG